MLSGTRVLKPETLALARRRVLNKHSSLLPAYRGRKAEFWTLYHKDLERLGVTVHEVDPGLDTGAILLQEKMSFGHHDSHVSLRIRSQDLGARLLSDAVERLEREPGWRGAPQPDGDWRTYRAPTLDELTQYRGRLRELRREAGGKP